VRAIGIDCHWLKVGANDAYSGSVTVSAFKTRIENLIVWVREKAGNPIARIIVSSEVFRKDGTSELNAEFNQYAGVLYEIAEADPYVLFLNSRLATEIAGWNAATENFTGLTNRGAWSSASVAYVLGDYVSVAAPAGGEIAYYRCTIANTSSASNGPGTRNWAPHSRYLSDQVHYTQAGAMLLANLEVGLIRSVMGYQSSTASVAFTYPAVSRNVADTTPILFTWPVPDATITVTRSIDAGSYGAATGGATYAYTQDGQHFYSLAHSANDRPAGAGSVVYRLNDGTVVRLLPLQVEATSAEEVVDEIENRGITTVAVQSGVTNATTLELIQGDTYDGTGKPLLGFVVTKDYTSGWTATLTIRDEDDAVISTTTGVVASATSITFSLTAPTGLPMSGCPGSFKGKFDVQMSNGSSRDTVTRGACYVYEDQTRT
jgi:lysophospholipase L1-like esterase